MQNSRDFEELDGPYDEWTDARALQEYSYTDEDGRRYKKVPIHAPGVRNGETGQLWRGMLPPPGKHWQYIPAKLDELDAKGEIYWSPTGNPRRKVYLEGSAGVPVQDIWMDFKDAHNQNIKITGYPTEKNPLMLQRIIEASSDPGDLVLDCFAGSGTTLAVAAQTGRRWVGVDNSALAIATISRRLACGLQPMGDFVTNRLAQTDEPEKTQLSLLLERHASDDYAAKDFALWADRESQTPMLTSGIDLEAVADAFLKLSDRNM